MRRCLSLDASEKFILVIPDPREMQPAAFNNVRDEIEGKVRELLSSL
jgi:hypothetical protein